jgi:alkanesulfonate monooxygenase SsuD/methylene tetrahydromethanopterin reductase-like flavin-dependent oxidoreductase (luciferase family)
VRVEGYGEEEGIQDWLRWTTVFGFQGETATDLLEAYRNALRAGGHHPATKEIAALVMVYCAETTEQARKEFADPAMWYYRTISKYVAPSTGQEPVKTYELYTKTRDLAAHVTWEQLLEAGAVVCGDRDHCLERIADLQKRFGLTQLLCWTRLGGLDHRKVLRSMELMSKHVIPHFKRAAKEAM